MQQKKEIITLIKQEQTERNSKNFIKSLECCIKILHIYLNENEYLGLLEIMKKLSLESAQSFFSIFGMLKFTIKKLYPIINESPDLMSIYLTTILHILNSLEPSFKNHCNQSSINEMIKMLKNKKNITSNLPTIFNMIESFEYNNQDYNSNPMLTNISSSRNYMNTTGIIPITDINITTNNSICALKEDTINFPKSTKQTLPYIILLIEITLNNTQLKESLQSTMLSLNTTISNQPNHTQNNSIFTVIKRDSNIIRNICQFMFPSNHDVTIVQCRIKPNSSNRYDRLLEIKSLNGNPYTVESLIISFIKKLIPLSKSIQIIRHLEGFFRELGDDIKKGFNEQHKEIYTSSIASLYEEKSSMVETINREAANYYEIYRIISQENYDVGKMVAVFINDFKGKYTIISNMTQTETIIELPQQMKEIMLIIDQCVETFNNYFNFGKSSMENMLKCCRPAIEKYIFNKLYYVLYDIYNRKYSEINNSYINHKKIINDKLTLKQIMIYLEIKEHYWCLENYVTFNCIPYKSTIDCLNKIDYEQSPRDKFDTMINAGLDLRNTILGLSNNSNVGKNDLNSMDDELPLFIYIGTQVNLRNIFAELHMVEDYLKYSSSEDKESKVLTNLMSSVFYINSGWEVDKIKEEQNSII